jgi:hypothetical protein
MPADGFTTMLTVGDIELEAPAVGVVGRPLVEPVPEREADKLPLFIACKSGNHLLVDAELTTNYPSESLAIMLSERGPPGPLTKPPEANF